jgi:hypothetical protein
MWVVLLIIDFKLFHQYLLTLTSYTYGRSDTTESHRFHHRAYLCFIPYVERSDSSFSNSLMIYVHSLMTLVCTMYPARPRHHFLRRRHDCERINAHQPFHHEFAIRDEQVIGSDLFWDVGADSLLGYGSVE